MAVIVEDGTGKPDAEVYVSLADFKAWATKRLYDITPYPDATIEAKMLDAAMWIDTKYRYGGTKLVATQALEFPRAGLVDWSGNPVVGVPSRVQQAENDLTWKGFTQPLYIDAARDGAIQQEVVGPLSVTYFQGAPSQTTFSAAEQLLKPYVIDESTILGGPYVGGMAATSGAAPSEPTFDIGMNDNPGTIDPLV